MGNNPRQIKYYFKIFYFFYYLFNIKSYIFRYLLLYTFLKVRNIDDR